MVSFRDRVKGVVFGTAYGDALGAPVEKLSFNEIKKSYGRIESTQEKWHKADLPAEQRLNRVRGYGIITDDTLMTQALMRVYCVEKRHLDAYDLANEFVKEIAFRPQYIPEFGKEAMILDRLFYPEKHIFLRHVLANCDPREGGQGNMVNCGAVMYIAPIGVVNACNPKGAYDEAIAFASGHQISYGLEAAGVLAACIAKAFEPGTAVDDIVETALFHAKDGTREAIADICNAAQKLKPHREDREYVVKRFQEILIKYSPMSDDVNRSIDKVGRPTNHYTPSRLLSIEELPVALGYIVLHDGDFEGAIKDGVSSGRDTDSIGVIIGSILGAKYGWGAIPSEEIEVLEKVNKLKLENSAEEFSDAALYIIKNDLELARNRNQMIKNLA